MKICQRFILLACFALGSSAAAQDKVGEIDDTTKIERRVEARDYTVFGLGPVMLKNTGSKGSGQYVKFGHIWEATTHGATKLTAHGAFNFSDNRSSILAGTIGGNLYMSPTNISPYVGLEFGYGLAATDADDLDTVAGWVGGASLGVALFRTSSVQLHGSVDYLHLFTDTGDGQPSYLAGTVSLLF